MISHLTLFTLSLNILIISSQKYISDPDTYSIRPGTTTGALKLCLEVVVGDSDNNVISTECTLGKDTESWEKGNTDSDGYYTLISLYNNECLDVTLRTGNIHTYSCTGGDHQLWKLEGTSLKSKAYNNQCLDHDGEKIYIGSCSQNIVLYQETNIESSYYDNICLRIGTEGIRVNGGYPIYYAQCPDENNIDDLRYYFRWIDDGNNAYRRLKSLYDNGEVTNRCIDIQAYQGGVVQGRSIYINGCKPNNFQRWKLNGDGKLESAINDNGERWCISGGGNINGGPATIQDCEGLNQHSDLNGNQEFDLSGIAN